MIIDEPVFDDHRGLRPAISQPLGPADLEFQSAGVIGPLPLSRSVEERSGVPRCVIAHGQGWAPLGRRGETFAAGPVRDPSRRYPNRADDGQEKIEKE